MWNVRAVFDVKLGLILKDETLLTSFAKYWAGQPKSSATGSVKQPASQKQYLELLGNDIYQKRPFENQAKCYFCNESFALKAQITKLSDQ